MKYFLYKNKLTPDPNDCVAKVTQQETISYEEVVARTTRRGITITDTELTGAVNEVMYTIIEELNKGNAVETPFARFRPTIGGVFINEDDSFDPNRHTVKVNCIVGKSIKLDPGKMTFEKVKYVIASPIIQHILDYPTQEENATISPDGIAEIKGELLKIDTGDSEQGLFFIQNGTTVKVDVIFHNMPSYIIFKIPAKLSAGQYQLEIRNKTNKNDKTLKNCVFASLLTVK